MKNARVFKNIVTGSVLAAALTGEALAIEGLTIHPSGTNIVLSWPNSPSESYIVLYKTTVDSTTTWQVLTNGMPGDDSGMGNFIHYGVIPPHNSGGSNSSGGPIYTPPPPLPTVSNAVNSTDDLAATDTPSTPLMPPLPWDTSTWPSIQNSSLSSEQALSATTMTVTGGTDSGPTCGFYEVVRDGVYIIGSSNLSASTLSNTVSIFFEAGNTDSNGTNVLVSATLLVDGTVYPGDSSVISPPFTSPWRFQLDTRYLQNGDHTVQIQVAWYDPNRNDNQYPTRWSDGVAIQVYNHISYPDWEPEIGELGVSAYFASTTCPDTNWQIDIYDSTGSFVKSLTGNSTNGAIEAYWDMVDHNGVTRTNANIDPWFDSVLTVGDPIVAALPRKKQRKQDWPSHGVWTIAYQDFFKFEYSQNNAMQSAINSFALTAGKYGGYWVYYPQAGQTNDIGQTYPLRLQKTNHLDTNINATTSRLDTQMLCRFLSSTNSRNFFFDGHGSPSGFAELYPSTLTTLIHHRYRFVFIDGCNTANGNLDKVFGINGAKQFDASYYHKTGIRPAAFVGYKTSVNYADGVPITVNGVRYDDSIPWQVPGFISNFLFYWDTQLMGYGLLSAINNAKSGLPPVGNQYREDYLAIHGYYNLHIDEVNHRTDTW